MAKKRSHNEVAEASTPAATGPTPGSSKSSKRRRLKASTSKKSKLAAPTFDGVGGADINVLPDNTILLILQKLGFPHRFTAMQVCRRWRNVGRDPRFTLVHKPSKGNLMDTIQRARAGDTVKVPAGFYQEMLLIEKPLRLIGEMVPNISDHPRKGVVFQGSSSVVAMANARCCFENIVFRSATCSQDRSIVCFGPDCDYIRMYQCEVAGASGMQLPQRKDPEFNVAWENGTAEEAGEQSKAKGKGSEKKRDGPAPVAKLVLEGCYLHSILGDTPAVLMETGFLRMQGCTVTNNSIGIDVMEPAMVHITNNDISFNSHAITMDGGGVIADNVMWGNLHHDTINLSPSALPEAGTQAEGAADEAGGSAHAGPAAPSAEGPAGNAGTVHAAGSGGGDDAEPGSPRSSRPRRQLGGRPQVRIYGNHIQTPHRKGTRSSKEVPIRKKVRELAIQVYGEHEHDYDDWQMIGDSDLDSDEEGDSDHEDDSSEEDSQGSDMESGEDGDSDDDDDDSDDDDGGFMGMMAHGHIPMGWDSDSSREEDEDYRSEYGSTSESDSGEEADDQQANQQEQAAAEGAAD